MFSSITPQRPFKFEGRMYKLPGKERLLDLLKLSPVELRDRFNRINKDGIPPKQARSILTTAFTQYLNEARLNNLITSADQKKRLEKWKSHGDWPSTIDGPLWYKNPDAHLKSLKSVAANKSGQGHASKILAKSNSVTFGGPRPSAPHALHSGPATKGALSIHDPPPSVPTGFTFSFNSPHRTVPSSVKSSSKGALTLFNPSKGPAPAQESWTMPPAPNRDLQDVTLQYFHDVFWEANPGIYRHPREWDVILDQYKKYVQKHFGTSTLKQISANFAATDIRNLIPQGILEKHIRQLLVEDEENKRGSLTNPVTLRGHANEAVEASRKRLREIDVFGSPEPDHKQIKLEQDEDNAESLRGDVAMHDVAPYGDDRVPKVETYRTLYNRPTAAEEKAFVAPSNVTGERPLTPVVRTRGGGSRLYSPSMPNIWATKPTFLGSDSFIEETGPMDRAKGASPESVDRDVEELVEESVASGANTTGLGVRPGFGSKNIGIDEATQTSDIASEEDERMAQRISSRLGGAFADGNGAIIGEYSSAIPKPPANTLARELATRPLPTGTRTSTELRAFLLPRTDAYERLVRLEAMLRGGVDDLDVTLQAIARLAADDERIAEHVRALVNLRSLHRAAVKEVCGLVTIVGGGSA